MKKTLIIALMVSVFLLGDECFKIHNKVQDINKSITTFEERRGETTSELAKKFYSWAIEKYNGAIEILEKEIQKCK